MNPTNPEFQRLMQEATRLTQAGDLQAATATIQAALGRAGAEAVAAANASHAAASASAADMAKAMKTSPWPSVMPDMFGDMMDSLSPRVRAAAAAASADVIDVEAREVPGADTRADRDTATSTTSAGPEKTVADAEHEQQATSAGSRFIAGSHADPVAGVRDYKLFIPSAAGRPGAAPMPLVVMLHGCTQNPDDFAAGTRMNEAAEAQGFYVLYPAQSQKANAQRCWNWFKHNHQQRGRGEAGLLAGMTRAVMAQHDIDAQRVYAAGLSAGGAMAAILGEAYPDLYAAVGVHSGLPAGAARDLPSALAAMSGSASTMPAAAGVPVRSAAAPTSGAVPTIVFHGDADSTVHPRNGEQVFARHGAGIGAAGQVETERVVGKVGRASTRRLQRDASGRVVAEHWLVHGAPHAWSGGSSRGSFTDASGPDASAEMLRFFFEHPGATGAPTVAAAVTPAPTSPAASPPTPRP